MGKIIINEFKFGMYKWIRIINPDPSQRAIGNLQSDLDGKFDDITFIEILTASMKDCAGIISC